MSEGKQDGDRPEPRADGDAQDPLWTHHPGRGGEDPVSERWTRSVDDDALVIWPGREGRSYWRAYRNDDLVADGEEPTLSEAMSAAANWRPGLMRDQLSWWKRLSFERDT